MKILILLAVLAACASRPVPRKDIQIKMISANEFEMRIPGVSVSETELEEGILDPHDSKANYSVVFFKERDFFKGMTKTTFTTGKGSLLTFKMRTKDKTEIVTSDF